MKFNKIIYILLFVPFLFSCKSNDTTPKTTEDSTAVHQDHVNMVELNAIQAKNANIGFGSIEMRQLSGSIKVSGMLDVPPQNLVSVTAPLGGFLSSTELLQGMRVKKGQVIAVLKSNDYIQLQQNYLENLSKLEFLQAEYERQQTLAKENVNAQKTLQQAKADYEGTKATVSGLKARLQVAGVNAAKIEKDGIQETFVITAPINGYVTQVNVNIGAFINPGVEMFRIVDTEHLHAEIRVFERDLSKVKLNNIVYFSIAHEGKQRKAHVYLIGREIEADRTVRIHCHLDNEDPELLPGMYINAIIETQSSKVPALPDAAIITYEDKRYIFIAKGSKTENGEEMQEYEMVEVKTGFSEMGYTEVLVPENVNITQQKIVTQGAYMLLAKMFNSEEEGHGH